MVCSGWQVKQPQPGEDTYLEDGAELVHVWLGQHTQRDVDHLQVCTGRAGQCAWPAALEVMYSLLSSAPFVPVTELMDRGRVLMSITLGDCSHGIRKCVPSPTDSGLTPDILSYMTALSPPSTTSAQGAAQCTPQTGPGSARSLSLPSWRAQGVGGGLECQITCVQRGLQCAGSQAHHDRPSAHSAQQVGHLLQRSLLGRGHSR